MPTPVQLKRNGTPGASAPSSLLHGELALNYGDARIFWRDASNVIQSFTFQSYALASHTHTSSAISDSTTAGRALLTAADAGAQRTALGLGTLATQSGTFSGTSSGTNTGDQTITLTGDVTGSGTGSFAATLANTAVSAGSYGSASAVGTFTVDAKGRLTAAGSTNIAIAASAVTSGTLDPSRLPFAGTIFRGAVIVSTGLAIDANGYLTVDFGSGGDQSVRGNDARLSDTRTPTDNTVSTAKIQNDAVTYAKIQNVSATDRLLGRSSAGAGDVEELDAATARTVLSVQPTASPAFTGAATFDNTGNVVPLTITNAGTANSLVVNDASGDTTPFVIDAAGNVGIGASAPSNPLHIANAIPTIRLEDTDTNAVALLTADNSGSLRLRADTGNAQASSSISLEVDTVAYVIISSTGTATFAGQVLVTAGSVSACSVAPSGDPNTGLYFPAADVAAWVTNGTERVRVGSGGRVQFFAADEKFGLQINKGATGNGPFIGSDGADIFTISTAGGAERLRLGSDGSLTASEVYGDTVGATNRDLFIDSTGLIGYVSSIRESKTDIVTLDDVSWLSSLSPVSYRYRKRNADGTYSDEADGVTDYGLIAEDVEAVRPELCFYDDVDGEPQLRGVTYSKLITPMLRYIQQLEQRIAALEERLSHG